MILARRGRPTCVLATGDPFHYGVGAELARLVPPDEMACFPQPSAFSLAAARLGWSLPDCACVSLHGRALERIIPHLQPGARILALSWDGSTPGRLAALLKSARLRRLDAHGAGSHGRPARAHPPRGCRGVSILPTSIRSTPWRSRSWPRAMPASSRLRPALPMPGSRMTASSRRRRSARSPWRRSRRSAGELLWDIGAGCGLGRHRMVLRHPRNRCIAIEERPDRAERAQRNALQLGVRRRSTSAIGQAPEALGRSARRRMPSSSAAAASEPACSRPPGRR